MKRLIIYTTFCLLIFTCKAQQKTIELNSDLESNYLISNITKCHVLSREMFNGSFYINIFELADSKISPKNNQETEEPWSSFLISAIPDGDYYTLSTIKKIEGVFNPEFLGVKELEYPNFEVSIEHGFYNNRKKESFLISVNF